MEAKGYHSSLKRIAVPFPAEKPQKLAPYLNALREAGLDPVHITPGTSANLNNFAGLLLPGGADIHPSRYGQHVTGAKDCDPERDELEFQLLSEALARDLPVLAICRGHQLLNIHQNGTLKQHIENHRGLDSGHQVALTAGSKLAQIYGAHEVAVNSRHHQAVDVVASTLTVTAVSPDGYIEGVWKCRRARSLFRFSGTRKINLMPGTWYCLKPSQTRLSRTYLLRSGSCFAVSSERKLGICSEPRIKN